MARVPGGAGIPPGGVVATTSRLQVIYYSLFIVSNCQSQLNIPSSDSGHFDSWEVADLLLLLLCPSLSL
jgi:hypothetical protein